MPSSVWPYDTFTAPKSPLTRQEYPLRMSCFVATPYEPRERWDDLFELIRDVAAEFETSLGIAIDCRRADQITSAGIVHPEIWKSIREADFIICDVTGRNGNVMVELGVASAWRLKEHVIILRDKADQEPHLFDINPARHVEYEISYKGIEKLRNNLRQLMFNLIASMPFEHQDPQPISLPFNASLSNKIDVPVLYTPDITHRRMLDGYLEFGAPLSYRHSWMTLGDLSLKRVHVKATMKMTLSASTINPQIQPNDSFVGIMVRGQSFFANFGHLTLVRPDGGVYLTKKTPEDPTPDDDLLGNISDLNINEFIDFDITIDDSNISVKTSQGKNTVETIISLKDLPYVFPSGRVIFIAGLCRSGIKDVEIEAL